MNKKEYRRVELEVLIKLSAEYIEKRKGFKLTKQGNYRLAFAKAVYSVAFRENEKLLKQEEEDMNELLHNNPQYSLAHSPLDPIHKDIEELNRLNGSLDNFDYRIGALDKHLDEFESKRKNKDTNKQDRKQTKKYTKARDQLEWDNKSLANLTPSNNDYTQKLKQLESDIQKIQSEPELQREYGNELSAATGSLEMLCQFALVSSEYANKIGVGISALCHAGSLSGEQDCKITKVKDGITAFRNINQSKDTPQNVLTQLEAAIDEALRVVTNTKHKQILTGLKAAVGKLLELFDKLEKISKAIWSLSSSDPFTDENRKAITQLENDVSKINLDEIDTTSGHALKEHIAKLRECANKPEKIKGDIAALRQINPLENKFQVALTKLEADIETLERDGNKQVGDLQHLKETVAKLRSISPLAPEYRTTLKSLEEMVKARHHSILAADPLRRKSRALLGANIYEFQVNAQKMHNFSISHLMRTAKNACIAHIQRNSFAAARVALSVCFSYVLASGNIPEARPENKKLMLDLRKAEQRYVVDMEELETRLGGNPLKDGIIAHRRDTIQRGDYVDKADLIEWVGKLNESDL